METRHGGIKKRKWCDLDYLETPFEGEEDNNINSPYKIFKEGDAFEDNETRKDVLLPSLRTPIRNCIPNYFVPKKITDHRGKKKSNQEISQQQQRDGRTNYDLICDCCNNHDRSRFTQDTQNCPVCEDCGVVQTSQITYCDELQESQKKNKQGYKRRSYLGERLRQFSDSEPRIPEPDLEVIRHAYARLREAFNQNHPLFKKSAHKREKYIERLVKSFTIREEDTTKQHIKALLDFIDHTMDTPGILTKEEKPPSFKKKYLERWAQIKKYFCGDRYYFNCLVTKPTHRILNLLFKVATLVTIIYDDKSKRDYVLSTSRYSYIKEKDDEEFLLSLKERVEGDITSSSFTETTTTEEDEGCCGVILFGKEKKQKITLLEDLPDPVMSQQKRNIPSVDLLFLMILFADGEDTLEIYGWYFVKKIMHQYTFCLPKLEDGKSTLEVMEEREKKRKTKYNALRSDFLTLKKILTHINIDHKNVLENIPEFIGEQIETPNNISQIIRITARNKELYQYTT